MPPPLTRPGIHAKQKACTLIKYGLFSKQCPLKVTNQIEIRANDNLLRVFSNTRFVSATARFHFEALFNAGFKESDIIKQVLGLELLLSVKRLQ